MELSFSGEVFYWRGPSPFHFVTVPDEPSAAIESASALVTYGWGMIPVTAVIGPARWTTSLWPRDGLYVVPLKVAARRTAGIELGDTVDVRLTLDL